MPYKLPGIPSSQASACELADFIEIECLKSSPAPISFASIQRCLGIVPDESAQPNEPFEDEPQNLVEAFEEVRIRKSHCGCGFYPFFIEEGGCAVRCDMPEDSDQWLYPFLLMATRLKMTGNHVHAGIDGTKLFEKISGEILKNYWGASRSESFVFGTATTGSFKDKINDLCERVGEGRSFSGEPSAQHQQDGKLDVVVWTSFSDERSSKLIGFAQCKTGTSWAESLSQLQAEAFCHIWLDRMPLLLPIRIFCIADREVARWVERANLAGLFFDRCRIMDYSNDLSPTVLDEVQSWSLAALEWVKSE